MIFIFVPNYEPIEALRDAAGAVSGKAKEIAMEVFLISVDLILIIAAVAAAIRQFLLINRERAKAAAEIRRQRVAEELSHERLAVDFNRLAWGSIKSPRKVARYHWKMNSRRQNRIVAFQVHLAQLLQASLDCQAAAGFLANRGVSHAVALRVLNQPAKFRRLDAFGPYYSIDFEDAWACYVDTSTAHFCGSPPSSRGAVSP